MYCIVFDMDDTLYPEQAFALSAFQAVGEFANKSWGMSGLAEQAAKLFHAGERKNVFQQAFCGLGYGDLSEQQSNELLLVYRTHQPASLPWFPDARRAVEALSEKFPLSLISDGFLPTQRNKAKALGIERWISNPIFTEELGREHWKPSPKAFQLVMQRHPGLNYLYVADNPGKDFVAPNLLGWKTVQIQRPQGQYRHVSPAQGGEAQIKINDLRKVAELIY